jgi:hypothetical protein
MTRDSKKKRKKALLEADFVEFVPAEEIASSAEHIRAEEFVTAPPAIATLAPSTKLEEMPPVFRKLAEPKLPEIKHVTSFTGRLDRIRFRS